MRLLSRLKRLAAGAAAATEAWGLVWTSDEHRYAGEVPEGSHLAIDLYFEQKGRVVAWAHDRLTSDPADLGQVFDHTGVRVGSIVGVEDSRLVLAYFVPDVDLPRYLRGVARGGAA